MIEALPGKLVVVRHAESEWNALGKWTGQTDICLSAKGFGEAEQFGHTLKSLGIPIGASFCSEQCRTRQTLEKMLEASGESAVPIVASAAINERDYGEYTGKNKWEMKELVGEERFNDIRRGWDVPIPRGETLKMVYERAVPFYLESILPLLSAGKNVLVVAHGNTIRALKKYIESVDDTAISEVEMPFGEILVYEVSPEGRMVRSHGATVAITPPNA